MIGYRYLPKDMIIKSILTIPLFSFFIFLLEGLGSSIPDPLLAALFTGLFTGIGFGFIFRAGSTTGGTSSLLGCSIINLDGSLLERILFLMRPLFWLEYSSLGLCIQCTLY
ncbi:YitT family protein [Bacillus sp. JCM 19041]|uniref:YitT family protein n=1 Tax=Bacillus sp. JCM 19041 TaxID=1460637 RepID=UPI000B216062